MIKRLTKVAEHRCVDEKSLNRFKNILRKKFLTSFIGSLSIFQDEFKDILKLDVPYDQLSDSDKLIRDKWNMVRTKILDNGNKQHRSVESELSLYDIKFVGYRIRMVVQGD